MAVCGLTSVSRRGSTSMSRAVPRPKWNSSVPVNSPEETVVGLNGVGVGVAVGRALAVARALAVGRALAADGPGSDGAFGLLINFGNRAQAPITPPSTVVLAQPDQGINGWIGESAPKARGAGRDRHHAPTPGRHAHRDKDSVIIKLGGGRRALGHALKVGPLRHPRPAKLRRR